MFAILLIVAGLYAFASTMTTAQVVFVFVALLLAGGVGWRLRGSRDAVATPQPEVIDAAPQLPEARWIPTDTGYTRSDTLDAKAQHIGQLLRDRRLQPTRANIKAVGMEHGVNGNEAASMIYRRFVEWEWADSVAQGQPGRWKDET